MRVRPGLVPSSARPLLDALYVLPSQPSVSETFVSLSFEVYFLITVETTQIYMSAGGVFSLTLTLPLDVPFIINTRRAYTQPHPPHVHVPHSHIHSGPLISFVSDPAGLASSTFRICNFRSLRFSVPTPIYMYSLYISVYLF